MSIQTKQTNINIGDNNPIIEIKNLYYSINNLEILSDISFIISRGDYIGIIGPNGAGKSTLIKIILRLLKPTKGEIRVIDSSANISSTSTSSSLLSSSNSNLHLFGYVPQKLSESVVNFPATVLEVILSGFNKSWMFSKLSHNESLLLDSMIKLCSLEKLVNRQISDLSGGEKQRVLIARALVQRPKILILDEPTTGIDIMQQDKFYKLLAEINGQGMAILLISHDIDIVAKEVKKVICLQHHIVFNDVVSKFDDNVIQKLYSNQFKYIHHNEHQE